MPLLSAFTPLGMLRLSGRASHGERIYRSIISGLSSQFDVTEGSRYEAWAFAEAMKLARVKYAAERAAGQALPSSASTLLAKHEADHGLVPAWNETTPSRRAAIAVRWRAPVQPTRLEVETALSDLLGNDFLALVTTSSADASTWPTGFTVSPSNLVSYRTARRLLRFLTPVSFIHPLYSTVAYEVARETGRSDVSDQIAVGDRLVVEAEVPGLTERVTVTAVSSETVDSVTTLYLTARFLHPHNAGCFATTGNYPAQTTTKRRSLIVLTPTAANDRESRRKVNDYMNRVARATSTWDIVQGSGGTTGTFTVGTSPIGAETIEPVSY